MQAAVIKGKDILNILNKLNNPADIDEIVNQIAPNCQQSKTKLLGTVKNALEAGIEYGYITKNEDNKYQVENLGRLKSSSEEDETAFPYGYKLQDQQDDCCRRARRPRCRRPRRRKSSCCRRPRRRQRKI
ncbi:hypothetical protein DOY81_010855 [Sarcophaga bullata]|nr:hypothetical protein DOY81_010855 [Sarcophaga bullata]